MQGQLDQRYRFAIQASDRAGNSLNAPVPLAETLISNQTPTVRVWGEVRNMRGEPVRNVPISIGPANGSTDNQGNYSLDVTAGTWDVTVDGRVLHRGVTFNQETHLPLTIVPDDIVRVRGEVRNMLGHRLPNVPFTIGSVLVVSDMTGRFDLWIPKGQADVTLDGRVLHRGMQFTQETHLVLVVKPQSNAVVNGDFEGGISNWQVGGNGLVAPEERPGYGRVLRVATGYQAQPELAEGGGNSTISQAVTVPPGNPHLTFVYQVDTEEAPASSRDQFEVIVAAEGQPANYVYREKAQVGWGIRSIDLTQYANQRVQLIFNVYQSSPERPTSVVLGEVIIGESPHVTQWEPLFLPLLHRSSNR